MKLTQENVGQTTGRDPARAQATRAKQQAAPGPSNDPRHPARTSESTPIISAAVCAMIV